MKKQDTKGFYIVDVDNIPDMDWDEMTNEEFIDASSEFMTDVFFCMAFNNGDISTDTQVIRFI